MRCHETGAPAAVFTNARSHVSIAGEGRLTAVGSEMSAPGGVGPDLGRRSAGGARVPQDCVLSGACPSSRNSSSRSIDAWMSSPLRSARSRPREPRSTAGAPTLARALSPAPARGPPLAAGRAREPARRGRRAPPRPRLIRASPRLPAMAKDVATPVARKPRRRAGPRSRRSPAPLDTGAVERVLAETTAGLSAGAVAERAGAGYGRVLTLLRELEAAGQVQRTGAPRSTLWRLVSDEERIAQRAAELEAQARARRDDPTRRRGRARAT